MRSHLTMNNRVSQKNLNISCKAAQQQNYVPISYLFNAKKSDLFDITWKFAGFFKICTKLMLQKVVKSLNGHKTSTE